MRTYSAPLRVWVRKVKVSDPNVKLFKMINTNIRGTLVILRDNNAAFVLITEHTRRRTPWINVCNYVGRMVIII